MNSLSPARLPGPPGSRDPLLWPGGVVRVAARYTLMLMVILVLLAGCAGPAAVSRPPVDYWPTAGWRTSAPERQGVDSERLARMFDAIAEQKLDLHSVVIVRNGYIIAEAYFHPNERETKHQVASATKSVIGMLTGIAVGRGDIKSVEQPVLDFFPERTIANLDEDKRTMTLEDLLTMSSGLDCRDQDGTYDRMLRAADGVQFTLDLPMVAKPGERFAYCSATAHLVSAVLNQATGKSARALANTQLFAPLGISQVPEGYWPADAQGISNGCCGLYLTPRDMAKLGLLYLQRGRWEGKQIVPAAWVAASGTRHATWQPGRDYGYLFWVYTEQGYFSAMGLGGQHIHIIPGKNMVVVFTAGEDIDGQDRMTKLVDDYVLPAAGSATPLDDNPEAAAALAARLERLADPSQPVSPLPPVAALISGRTYTLAQNPLGWRTLAFRFDPGSDTGIVTVDGMGLMIGLDGRYRPTGVPGAGTIELRGGWGAASEPEAGTFVVEALALGELQQQQLRFSFGGHDLTAAVVDKVFGTHTAVHGSAVDSH